MIVGEGQAPPGPVKRGADAQIVASATSSSPPGRPPARSTGWAAGRSRRPIPRDGGRTWRAGPNPSDSGAAIGHAFIDLAADEQGDVPPRLARRPRPAGPTTAPAKEEKRDANAPSPGKGLRYARSTDGGHDVVGEPDAGREDLRVLLEHAGGRRRAGGSASCTATRAARHGRRRVATTSATRGSQPVDRRRLRLERQRLPARRRRTRVRRTSARPTRPSGPPAATGGQPARSSSRATRGTTWSAPVSSSPATPPPGTPTSPPDPARPLAVAWDAYVDKGARVFAVILADGGKTWTRRTQLSAAGASATHPRRRRTGDGVPRLLDFQPRRQCAGDVGERSAPDPVPPPGEDRALRLTTLRFDPQPDRRRRTSGPA